MRRSRTLALSKRWCGAGTQITIDLNCVTKPNSYFDRVAPNKVKVITKSKDGRTYESLRCQLANGDMIWYNKDNESGKEMKLFYEKFTSLDGTWKPVCIEGAEKFGKAMGK